MTMYIIHKGEILTRGKYLQDIKPDTYYYFYYSFIESIKSCIKLMRDENVICQLFEIDEINLILKEFSEEEIKELALFI